MTQRRRRWTFSMAQLLLLHGLREEGHNAVRQATTESPEDGTAPRSPIRQLTPTTGSPDDGAAGAAEELFPELSMMRTLRKVLTSPPAQRRQRCPATYRRACCWICRLVWTSTAHRSASGPWGFHLCPPPETGVPGLLAHPGRGRLGAPQLLQTGLPRHEPLAGLGLHPLLSSIPPCGPPPRAPSG